MQDTYLITTSIVNGSPADKLARVAVVGTSCSGKTTFARSLAKLLDAEHIELDSLHWGPNWTPAPAEQFRDAVNHATDADQWVCDGNYAPVRDLVWERASAIVWLNYAFPTTFGRALKRTVKRCIQRTELYAGNRESFQLSFLSRESILVWVLKTHRPIRRKYRALLESPRYAHLKTIEFRQPADADVFLKGVEAIVRESRTE